RLHNILKQYWGYDSFRPLQHEIATHVVAGHDTLGLMPTGGGKSIVFQTAGLARGGLTLVVTPLISLMKDQVDNLKRVHIPAVYFHSGMTVAETRQGWENLTNNRARFLYTLPERLRSERFITELRGLNVTLIVVDEAHCISQWGYDFRPSFLEIAKLRAVLKDVPVLALTATATPEVADDIRKRLLFRPGHHTFQMSFERRNIGYLVKSSESKIQDVGRILGRTQGCAIVYVRSRKRTKIISDYLNTLGITSDYYHAGIEPELKAERQNKWKSGEVRVIVATNAFGMGIDKPDVRTVIHYDMPPSLEEYYQEAGRAGRDGQNSFAILLYNPADKSVLRRHLSMEFPSREYILKVYERVCNFLGLGIGEGYGRLLDFDVDLFCRTFRLSEEQVKAALKILGRAGYLEYFDESENASRVIMQLTREEMYNMPAISNYAERALHYILRTYPGTFSDYVYINERRIMRDTGIPETEIYNTMLELSRLKVMHYIPRRRTPAIYVSTSREEPKYVSIGRSIYEDRMNRLKRRIDAMIDYADNNKSCRVHRMLEYFGEPSPADCGGCDVCRGRHEGVKINEGEVRAAVVELLQQYSNGLSVSMIERHLGAYGRMAVQCARQLCEDGLAEIYGTSIRLKTKL
ncbi:MAG: RecQ family ATP-dependent DNA helicase, partial [Muribaculaceae bacterium]|nr:RecQ family ATP-dependent DNA helicase [Muribaculaceae bacterium]